MMGHIAVPVQGRRPGGRGLLAGATVCHGPTYIVWHVRLAACLIKSPKAYSKGLMRTLAFALLATMMACGGKHHLEEYRFSQRTLGVSFIEPPVAELKHGWYDVDPGGSALQNVVQAGAKVAKELEARKALSRLDSAERAVDLTELLANGTAQRASRYLGTSAATDVDAADYVLEIQMREFGIDARSNHATYLYSRAEAVLLDRRSGRESWRKKVRGSDRLTPFIVGTMDAPSAIFTAATLHTVSVAQFQQALEQLVVHTSNHIANELRADLRDAREK